MVQVTVNWDYSQWNNKTAALLKCAGCVRERSAWRATKRWELRHPPQTPPWRTTSSSGGATSLEMDTRSLAVSKLKSPAYLLLVNKSIAEGHCPQNEDSLRQPLEYALLFIILSANPYQIRLKKKIFTLYCIIVVLW